MGIYRTRALRFKLSTDIVDTYEEQSTDGDNGGKKKTRSGWVLGDKSACFRVSLYVTNHPLVLLSVCVRSIGREMEEAGGGRMEEGDRVFIHSE